MLLLITIYLQSRYHPFVNDELNNCEMAAILVACITIYIGLFCLSGAYDDNIAVGNLFFLLVLLVNL